MEVSNHSWQPKVLPLEGRQIGILFAIIDRGTVKDSFGDRRKVEFLFELYNDLYDFQDGKGKVPLIIDVMYAMTLGTPKQPSYLREALEDMTGKKLPEKIEHLEDYLGCVCELSIIHVKDGDATNARIKRFDTLRPEDAKREYRTYNPMYYLDLRPGKFDPKAFDQVIDWKKKKIMDTPEYKALGLAGAASGATGGRQEDRGRDSGPRRSQDPRDDRDTRGADRGQDRREPLRDDRRDPREDPRGRDDRDQGRGYDDRRDPRDDRGGYDRGRDDRGAGGFNERQGDRYDDRGRQDDRGRGGYDDRGGYDRGNPEDRRRAVDERDGRGRGDDRGRADDLPFDDRGRGGNSHEEYLPPRTRPQGN